MFQGGGSFVDEFVSPCSKISNHPYNQNLCKLDVQQECLFFVKFVFVLVVSVICTGNIEGSTVVGIEFEATAVAEAEFQ